MPPSQLKRLKATLRAEGITGPQPSKKAKRRAAANGANKDRRVDRTATLQNIREQFNPFEVTAPGSGRGKFEVTTNKTLSNRVGKGLKGRPGVSKSVGEENRRKTLLLEMQRRKKVGGIMDRRFGENDATMAPEEKMLERFTKEKQKRYRNGAVFDLEEEEEEGQLTHFGQSLSFDSEKVVDDFEDNDLEGSIESSTGAHNERKQKRKRYSDTEVSIGENGSELPERKKLKSEVMKEVIAKSKLHKYQRQQAKDDDEELREDLDRELPNLLGLLRGGDLPPPTIPGQKSTETDDGNMNPARAAMMNGMDKTQADTQYDLRLREMVLDRRSKPTERTKTEEEKAEEEARRLQELEERRLRRMRGEVGDSEEPEATGLDGTGGGDNEVENFGLGLGIPGQMQRKEFNAEDEDDFIIDDDLVAGDSDASSESGDEMSVLSEDDEDRDFLDSLAPDHRATGLGSTLTSAKTTSPKLAPCATIAYTFPCPQTHGELLQIVKDVALQDLPTVVRRVRTLHHPKLHKDNKEKLGRFSATLVEHLAYLADQPNHPSFLVVENLIRHVHSLSKSYPEEIARAFRSHLQSLHENRPLAPTAADLIILTAIGSIFPTSDHFHNVVTPAILSIARYLGQSPPTSLSGLATGTYLVTLCLQYQRLSKRYIPEVVNYVLNALCILMPTPPDVMPGNFPKHEPASSLRLQSGVVGDVRLLQFWDILPQDLSIDEQSQLKATLIEAHITLTDSAAELWAGKPAFYEVFEPALKALQLFLRKECGKWLPLSTKQKTLKTSEKLRRLLKQAQLSRRPLTLHYHRPLAIRTSIPKFEESYNPDRHYDPDRERAEVSKLRAEYKRERKGAMRELRKDANFIARESLKEKKERDREYERKYKRLVAEIQGEEGHEKKEYERERRMRKGRR
ncbi:MAG: nucleolar complex protein 14 [Geoglossum simile]|nr:MAG: nucleolar complex protein 14 [Geoglossum simile]